MSAVPVASGFGEPVGGAQRAFRALLQALAQPGTPQYVAHDAAPPPGLTPATAALLLALTDEETAIWWQRPDMQLAQWLRFFTGAPSTAQPEQAAFAVVTAATAMPSLDCFAPGSATAPEFSTTLLIEVPALTGGAALEWRGPGIRDLQRVAIDGLPALFWAWWQSNGTAFPQGVDVVFAAGTQIVGLPRTTRVRRLEPV
ncbi:MAG: phosphonate C-P lyase system protein PhnH [Betaproteobacteria bacterium]